MRYLIATVLCFSVAFASQTGDRPQLKKANVAGVDQKAPVTRSEAAAVFVRARKAILAARVATIPVKSTIPAGNQPVTRDEIIVEMGKIFELSKKSAKFIPAPVKFNQSLFKVTSTGAKSNLGVLVSWGFVAPVGPLATGPKPIMSVAQFGDAIGFFLARLADVTHMPSPRWSPYLMPNDGS